MSRPLLKACLAATVLGFSAPMALADFQLTILHINDFHARFEPINKYDSTCSAEEAAEKACFGGIARLKAAIDAARSKVAGGHALVLSAGDEFQGSLFYTRYKSAPVAEFMNGMGFDAVALGNHEFDDGPEELAKLLDALDAPVISGNTLAGLNTPIAGKFEASTVKEIGGEKIGILSVLATDTDETSSPGNDVLFGDEISYLKEAVAAMTAEGIDKIVLLSHVGYERDKEIAAAVDGIDVIVGGHSHTLLSNSDEKAAGPYPTRVKNPAGTEVPIVTAGAYSRYLGTLQVTFDDTGKVTAASGEPQLLDQSVPEDEAFKARVAQLAKPLDALRNTVVAEAAAEIDGSRETCRAQECTMGVLVADAMLDRVKDQGITLAIQNGGGLRASIDAGPVTMGEVLSVLPFQNTLATFQLKGADVKAALENGVSGLEKAEGRFPQVAGLRYAFDAAKPAGSRITSVEVKEGDGFVALDPDKTYGVVTNNYMRGGGDGYAVFADKAEKAYDFGPNLETVVADYLAKNRPYSPKTDGRVMAAAAFPAAATPAPAATEAAAPAEAIHVVKRGDTLWDIAAAALGAGSRWKELAAANGDPAPRRLAIGTRLTLPAR